VFADNAHAERFWTQNGWIKRPQFTSLQKVLVPSELKRCC
jgi:hypothetical protein